MVRSKYLLAAAVAVAAGLTVFSCTKKEESQQESKVGFATTDAQFSQDGKATLSLAVSPAASSKVSVIIAAGSEAQEGFTAVPATALSFESSISIEPGANEATVDVSVDLAAVENGQQAVLTISAANGATLDAQKATAYIKVVKSEEPEQVNLSGASVWGVIGGFNEWAGDVELTKTADSPEKWEATGVALSGEFKFRGNKEWGDYDLGAAQGFNVVPGEEFALVHKGSNITIAEGTYDIVLYPTELKAVITASEVAPGPGTGSLDWTVVYNGCNWIDGYYSYGQLEVFEVSGTNGQYYYPVAVNVDEGESMIAALQQDPEAFFASLQEEIDYYIQDDMDTYGDTREEAVPYVLYNEDNDGPEILFQGFAAGNYEFAVFTTDDLGYLDKNYQIITFAHPEDALLYYPFVDQASVNDNWTAEWDGWEEGREGNYFWVTGKASGAAYISAQWYTQDEIEMYYGTLVDLLNAYGTDVYDYFAAGYSAEDIGLSSVDSDGNFEYRLNTYGETGPVDVYIIGFDSDGTVMSVYGVSEVEIPEYVAPPIEWAERTDWALNFDESENGIVVSACDAAYYAVGVYASGSLEELGLDAIAEEVGSDITYYASYGFSMDMLAQYGYCYSSVPATLNYKGLENGDEAFIFGFNSSGKLTGEWHMETLTGVVEPDPVNWVERTDWAINYDASIDTEDPEYPQAVVVTACDAAYFDIDLYEAGTLEEYGIDFIGEYHEDWTEILAYYNETMDDQVEQGYMGSASTLPYVTSCRNLENGVEAYIFSYNSDGTFTGEWHMEPITGIEDVAAIMQKLSISGSAKPAVRPRKAAPVQRELATPVQKLEKKQHSASFTGNEKLLQSKAPVAKKTDGPRKKIVRK